MSLALLLILFALLLPQLGLPPSVARIGAIVIAVVAVIVFVVWPGVNFEARGFD